MTRTFRLMLIFCGLAAILGAQDIVTAAASPYTLAKFVETHSTFEWKPLWSALHITDQSIFLPPCEESPPGAAGCASELVAIVDLSQVIVVLEHRDSMFQVFLRYQMLGSIGWRFTGAYAPHVKYFRPEHRIISFGAKPFLVVVGQGNAGSGMSSKVESWIDLTTGEFEPVLNFTSEGDHLYAPIGRDVTGLVVSLTTQPVERVAVAFDIRFHVEVGETGETVPVGERRDRVVYGRTGGGKFKVKPSLSTASVKDVEDFYDDMDSEFTKAEFLKFNLNGLIVLATSQNSRGRAWLADYLRHSPDTPESRQLKALLAAPH